MTATEMPSLLEPDPAPAAPVASAETETEPGTETEAKQPPAEPGEAAASIPAAAPRPAKTGPRRRPNAVLRATALAVSFLGVAALGFFAYFYGFSGLAEARSQSTLYKTFAGQLGQAVAPVGAAPDGAPVAIMDVPALGISGLVVVAGTSSADLTHGPGLLSSSAVPGQAGVSVVYGRAAAFGAPFAHLMRLNRGDRITVVTGQGTSTYSVVSFGDSAHPAHNPFQDQLDLETADRAGFATGYEEVTADLVTVPKLDPGHRPAAGPREAPLAGDTAVVVPLILWSEALIVVGIGGVLMARRWSRAAVALCSAPVALALLWMVYENLAVLLPNLY